MSRSRKAAESAPVEVSGRAPGDDMLSSGYAEGYIDAPAPTLPATPEAFEVDTLARELREEFWLAQSRVEPELTAAAAGIWRRVAQRAISAVRK
jgi:hypothetical protein